VSAIALIVPGSIGTRTGGYEYDRQIAAALRARGWAVDVHELHGDFPNPSAGASSRAAAMLAAIPDRTIVVVDGLAFGALPDQVAREAERLRFVALVHMPLAFEMGLDRDQARERERRERAALGCARLVLVTGKATAGTVERYGIARDRIAIVEPGTHPARLAAGSGDPSVVHLVCVATLGPGKGHDILFGALASIPDRNWRLTCAGNGSRYPATVQALRSILRDTGLDDRVTIAGEMDGAGLEALYDSADLFVLATLYETYGMAVAEALARGLPVVATATGAIAELVGDEAGIVVPPGDQAALANALASALDPRVRRSLGRGSQHVRERLVTWEDAADRMAQALERIDR
jgi:glycosyltransferase involved in cell wall biosynthesis